MTKYLAARFAPGDTSLLVYFPRGRYRCEELFVCSTNQRPNFGGSSPLEGQKGAREGERTVQPLARRSSARQTMAYSGPDEPAGGYLDDSTSQIELLLGSEDDGRAFARIKEHGRRRAWTVQRCYRCLENLLRDLLLHQRRRFRCRASSPAHTLWLLLKILIFLVGGFVLVSVVQAILHPSYQRPPEHYAQLQRRILASSGHGRANQKDEKIFIAANIIREDLIRGAWGASLLELVDLLGEDNVFVSVYENDSGKATSEALIELQDKLPCSCSLLGFLTTRTRELTLKTTKVTRRLLPETIFACLNCPRPRRLAASNVSNG